MSVDLANLTPAPWGTRTTDCGWVAGPNGHPVLVAENDDDEGQAAVAFAVLARNAFDVMVQRGWTALSTSGSPRKWFVVAKGLEWHPGRGQVEWDDPFTALIEAERYYRENVERRSRPEGVA